MSRGLGDVYKRQLRKAGDVVNLENDIVGKYIEKFITFEKEKPKSGITKEFLLKNGF